MSQKSKKITAVIHCPGDRETGIPDGEINISFGEYFGYNGFFDGYRDTPEQGREFLREALQNFADEHFKNCGKSKVMFGDELEKRGREIW